MRAWSLEAKAKRTLAVPHGAYTRRNAKRAFGSPLEKLRATAAVKKTDVCDSERHVRIYQSSDRTYLVVMVEVGNGAPRDGNGILAKRLGTS